MRAIRRLGAALTRRWFSWSHTTRLVLVLVPLFLGAMTVGIVLGVQRNYLGPIPTSPAFTTRPPEPQWTTTAPTTPRRSRQVSGATATSINTNPGWTGTTTQGHRSRADSTTTSTSTGGPTSTRDTAATTTTLPTTLATSTSATPTASTPTTPPTSDPTGDTHD